MGFLDEEIRCDFKVNTNRKLLWQKEITMLDWLENVCQKEGLDYFLIGGSEIGAVRHKGFIPWDDDIDIGMLRVHFDKFLAVYRNYLPNGYEVQFGLDKEHGVWNNILRVRDNSSTGIIDNQIGKNISHGVFIEIYPYDEVPGNRRAQKQMARKIMGYTMVLQDKIGQTKVAGKRGKLLKILYRNYSPEKLEKRIDALCRKYAGSGSTVVSMPILPQYLYSGTEVLDKSEVAQTVVMQFEYTTARVPIGYDSCLTRQYGEYMKLPAIEERGKHHSTKVFYDATKPYSLYKERTIQELFDKYGFLL